MPPLAVCQGVHRLAVPARFARWLPDAPDAVADCRESGANGGGTPGDGPPTTCPAPAAAASPAPARSPTNCAPRRSRVTRWRSTAYAATSSCFRAMPRQSGAPDRRFDKRPVLAAYLVEPQQLLHFFKHQLDVIVTSHKIRMVRPSRVAILQ